MFGNIGLKFMKGNGLRNVGDGVAADVKLLIFRQSAGFRN